MFAALLMTPSEGAAEKYLMVIAVFLTVQPVQTLFDDAESPREPVRLGSRLAVMSCTHMPSQFIPLGSLLWAKRALKTSLYSFVVATADRRRFRLISSIDL